MIVFVNYFIVKIIFYKYYLFILWYLNNLFSCVFIMCIILLFSFEVFSCGMKENKNGLFL